MKTLLMLVLLAAPALAHEPSLPPCTSGNRGMLWPEQANSDAAARKKAIQCGALRMCTRGLWRYRWEAVSVHIRLIGKDPGETIPGCEVASAPTASGPMAKTDSANSNPPPERVAALPPGTPAETPDEAASAGDRAPARPSRRYPVRVAFD